MGRSPSRITAKPSHYSGQSLTLSGGQQVSEAANGSVSISESNFGENLTTTFTSNGSGGVDVTAQGQNVTLPAI